MGVEEYCIRFEDVHFSRGAKPVLSGMSLMIPKGKITAIMGPSGTGKTTLLRLIGKELIPSRGTVEVYGQNLAKLKRKAIYRLRQRMGVLFQQGALFTDLNVFDNVAFPVRQHTKLPADMLHDLVLMILEAVGLRGAALLRIDELSGGMARRVALARAIIMGPELMLYDEPFTGQDPIVRGVLLRLIRELNDAFQMTSVIVSHDVKETQMLADYVYIISGGKVIGAATPNELMQLDSPEVKQFINGMPDGPVSFRYAAKPYAEDLGLC
ncbi:MAG: ATP-binding cassette domain-containing protein [Gammaproteobacteria bacterium]|nr:ATP-binding cassette domain-containing protein [Gammaproteobacteria bacterium]